MKLRVNKILKSADIYYTMFSLKPIAFDSIFKIETRRFIFACKVVITSQNLENIIKISKICHAVDPCEINESARQRNIKIGGSFLILCFP